MGTLNKPTVGSTGWGSDVNENFDTTMESFAGIAGGRLSVSSSDPVPTTDQSGDTLYYLPYKSSKIALWDTTDGAWGVEDIGSSVSKDTTNLSADKNYDVFLYDDSGTLKLDYVAWTDDTTRATDISRKNGVWVKGASGSQSPGYRYLGTVRTISDSGIKFTDAEQKRYVWNVDNRLPRFGANRDGTASWTYNNYWGWRGMNGGDADWIFKFVRGLDEEPIEAYLAIGVAGSGAASWTYVAIGFDSYTTPDTTNNAHGTELATTTGGHQITVAYKRFASEGYHTLYGMESTGGGTSILYGGAGTAIMSMTIVG